MKFRFTPRSKKITLGTAAVLAVVGVNAPMAASLASAQYHKYAITQPWYQKERGSWTVLELPAEYQLNAIHAALLHTGKVLIVAGSGNKREKWLAGDLRTLLWDPAENTYKMIPTPADLFCAGHAFLPDGNLLVAGGTLRYEVLEPDVKRAAGPITVKNFSLSGRPTTLPKGTEFVSPQGIVFRSTADVTVPQAGQVRTGKNVWTKPGEAKVLVEAVNEGKDSIVDQAGVKYEIRGLQGAAATKLHGVGGKMTMGKQDYQGLRQSFVFNPDTERYELVSDMEVGRWYPTVTGLADGRVLAASGLDETGKNVDGFNEIYNPATRTWLAGPQQYFPTYPTLFLTAQGTLFYTGGNYGYGLAGKPNPSPGIWNLNTNTFTPVPGLRDPELTDASTSVLLPPAQDQKVMILGGSGAAESPKVTKRTDIIDLDAPNPEYTPGPDLPNAVRYMSAVLMPDDTVFTTGGAKDYRGKYGSDVLKAQFYHPDTNTFTAAADPTVGRNYHSEALLLPDGRVITLGSDSLYADKANSKPGRFEQRIEIYTPPYLLRGQRPTVTAGPQQVTRGSTVTFTTPDGAAIKTARLMRPSAVTHSTDVEQRSIGLDIVRKDDAITVTIPGNPALVPSGWYMLFVTNTDGVPSVARWVHVG